jgi:hypothetical protein
MDPTSEMDAVRGWLRRQGYPAEYEVARTLQRAGFRVLQGQYYADEEGGATKVREIDATADYPRSELLLRMAVEVKHSSAPWLVLTTALDTEGIGPRQVGDWMAASQQGSAALRSMLSSEHPLPWQFQGLERHGFNVVRANIAGANARESADPYEALNVVSKAANAHAEWAAGLHAQAVGLCLIVLDGSLYQLRYDQEGGEQLEPVDWSRIVWRGTPPGNPRLIDICTIGHLERYARHALQGMASMAAYLMAWEPESDGQGGFVT